jgi:hypothetical protein
MYTKKIYNLFLVLGLINLNIVEALVNCNDPSDQVLDRQLSAYKSTFYKWSDKRHLYSNSAFSSKDPNENNTECDDVSRFMTIIKKKSLCPYKIIEVSVEDMFPRKFKTAQCTCSQCSNTLKTRKDLTCLPFRQRIPVLIKSNLTEPSGGNCRWLESTQEININCFCAFKEFIHPRH